MTDKLYEIIYACEDKYRLTITISYWNTSGAVFQIKTYNLPYIYVKLEACFINNNKPEELAVFIFDAVIREIKRGLRR